MGVEDSMEKGVATKRSRLEDGVAECVEECVESGVEGCVEDDVEEVGLLQHTVFKL